MLTDLVLKNRSYRGYNKSRKVTKEELMELVDIARLCPSSANIQPLCYYLAWEPDEVARIQEQTRWAGAITHMKLPHPGSFFFALPAERCRLAADFPHFPLQSGPICAILHFVVRPCARHP